MSPSSDFRELPARVLAATAPRRQHERDVITGVELLDDGAGEPVETFDHGTSLRAGRPVDAGELVHLVARLAAETVGEIAIAVP